MLNDEHVVRIRFVFFDVIKNANIESFIKSKIEAKHIVTNWNNFFGIILDISSQAHRHINLAAHTHGQNVDRKNMRKHRRTHTRHTAGRYET